MKRRPLLFILGLFLILNLIAWTVTLRIATAPSAEELRQTPSPTSLVPGG